MCSSGEGGQENVVFMWRSVPALLAKSDCDCGLLINPNDSAFILQLN